MPDQVYGEGMPKDLWEGEELFVPCRHCTSVSLELRVKAGQEAKRCPKCKKDTRIVLRKDSNRWTIRTEAMEMDEEKKHRARPRNR